MKQLFLRRPFTGFTLVESIAVLFVMGSFCLLPVLMVAAWQEELTVRRFLNRFEKMVFVCQQIAVVEGRNTSIKNVAQPERMFLFYTGSVANNRPQPYPEDRFEALVIPGVLTGGNSIKEIKFLAESGHPSRLATVRFGWPKRGITYTYQFQLGGGRFEKE